MGIKHAFTSAKSDTDDSSLLQPSNWNADHVDTGYGPVITAMSGLVHRWKFDESSGDFSDSVGTLTLTVTGTPTYNQSAPVGGAAQFSATNYATTGSMGSIPVGASARTIIMVWKTNSYSTETVWGYGTWGSGLQYSALNVSSERVQGSAWGDDLNLGDRYPAGMGWMLTAYCYDGARSLSIFHNGDLPSRHLGGALNTVDGGTHFRVGLTINSTEQFTGWIDDLAVFNRALEPYELNRLFNALSGI